MQNDKEYLAHIPFERIPKRNPDDPNEKPKWKFKFQKVNAMWIRNNFGSDVLALVDKDGKWEDVDKEVAIMKIKTKKKEAV